MNNLSNSIPHSNSALLRDLCDSAVKFFVSTFICLLLITTVQANTSENFEIDGAKVSLKIPTNPAKGKPWLWIGEFAGHLKTLESGLVEKGWHVAYVSQSNKFGSPNAMAVWEKLYTELHDYEDNAGKLVEFWEQNKGRVKLFPKENGDHHPHGLTDPKPLIDLLVAEAK